MTALEKINSIIERHHVRFNSGELRLLDISLDDLNFILKAFKVMRKIAIERGEHDQSYREDEIVDEEFEERMIR